MVRRPSLMAFKRNLWSLLAAIVLMPGCGGSGSTYSGGGGGTPPTAPTGLSATAGAGQVSLAWTASGGATGYNVKRGTASGGPYTQLVSTSMTSFVDSSVTGGTTYYYVVTASSTSGISGNSNEASATPTVAPPPTPSGLSTNAGDKQVSLTWNTSTGAASYNVKRSTTHGGPYATVFSPAATSYNDTGLTDGTTYYYVVSAVNSGGESANSSEVSATPVASSASVHVAIDALTNRHAISPYIYGGAYPKNAATVTDSGLSVVRWGGNATSTYNWQLFTYNADNDYYFEDFNISGFGDGSDGDSTKFVQDVKAAGGRPLMTMPMLPWAAKSAEGNGNGHWSFSVAKYGAQCSVDKYNTDAGNGVKTDCSTSITGNDPNEAYVPLLDQPGTSDPPGSVYRDQFAAALATAFGSAPHFYDMDNEIDIWGGTHRDIHPNPSGYNELRDTYLTEARNLRTWDSQAIRLGPVSCCWWFYWNGENNNDKAAHAGVDFLPWWLNEVYWQDVIAGTRSLDVFDIHAYPDGPDTSGYSQAQKQALATSIYRDYWDPTYVSPSSSINQPYATYIQPNKTIPFRIPRMRAIVNATYPDTPLAFTEWSAAFAGESDFSTALGDAEAYGIMGRERVYLASRWTAPDPTTPNPNYLALKLFTNYDAAHHGFGTVSVSDTNDGNPNLFSSYAAFSANGTAMTLLVLNKDPKNAVTAQFTLDGFSPASFVSYTLASTTPTSITHSGLQSWSSTMSFAAYTATLLVISGSMASAPSSEWDLNPDTIMVPAGESVTLQPKIISGTANVTLTGEQSDSGISVAINQSSITSTQSGTITVTAGNTPGFYHFTVTGSDSVVTQTQGGWIVVGNPAASLAKTGDPGGGTRGTNITLTATLSAGQSGGSASGADILFSTDAGALSSRVVTTDSSGNASVTLTLPSTAGTVHVTAEGPYGLGHPVATFTETSQ